MLYTIRALFPYVGSSASEAVICVTYVPARKHRTQMTLEMPHATNEDNLNKKTGNVLEFFVLEKSVIAAKAIVSDPREHTYRFRKK